MERVTLVLEGAAARLGFVLFLVATSVVLHAAPASAASYTANGRVVDRNKGVPDAAVYVQAMPSEDVLATYPEGQDFTMVELGTGWTDSNGYWSTTFDTSSLPADYVSSTGQVDLIVQTTASDLASETFYSVVPGETPQSFETEPIDVRANGTPVGPPGSDPCPTCPPESQPLALPTCTTYWTGTYFGPYQTKFMDVLATGQITGVGEFRWGGSSSSTLGIAVKSGGSWVRASGTLTVSRATGAGYRATGLKDKRLYNLWRYREFVQACTGQGIVRRWAKPYSYYDRGNTLSISHQYLSYCGSYYYAGSTFFRTAYANQTYSAGLTFAGVVSLSSQAGYSTTAELNYVFGTRGRVCGNTSAGPAGAPKVEAHPA